MTYDPSLPRIELVDLASLASLAGQTSPDLSIGWSARLPVTPQTYRHWHQSGMPARVPEVWCAHLEASEDTATACLWIDAALPAFAGHFPGNPILPGILQIEWIRVAAERIFPAFGGRRFAGLANVKFKAPVRPATWLHLRLHAEPLAVEFVVESAGRVCTQGRVLYRSTSRQPNPMD